MKISWPKKHLAIYYDAEKNGNGENPIYIDYTKLKMEVNHKFQINQRFGSSLNANRLIHGDNLFSLQLLVEEQERNHLEPKIQCVYIDPPYNTGFSFDQYDDQFSHHEWLGLMYFRIKLLRQLMKESGLILIQLNDTEQPYLELILEDIFGLENKIGTIIWRRRQSQANLIKTVSTIHDYIVIYAKNKSKAAQFKIQGGLWTDPKKYGHNSMASKEIEQYLSTATAFATPKPELLIYHILKATTNPEDWVLDCFAGSGSTLAVAHKMHRKWIGIECVGTSCDLICQRLQSVIEKSVSTDVDNLVAWSGGGGFSFEKVEALK